MALGGVLLACASAPVQPRPDDDPVVAKARRALATQHPAGGRLAAVTFPAGTSRRGRIDALLAALGDPSTRLLTPEAWAAFLPEVSGGPTVGVGLRELLDLDIGRDGRLVVVTTVPGGPAARAGLAPGDVLLRVDEHPVRELGEAMAQLRGPDGSEVRLTLVRGGREQTVTLRREALPAGGAHVRAGALPGGALQVALDGFSPDTPAAMERALEGVGERPVVLDLRNNPGGALEAALAVAGLFLGEREVVRAVGRIAAPVLKSSGSAVVRGRVVVLVNRGTASAAELLAAALHDVGGAQLVGERTAGKALIHVPATLDDGSVLLISSARLLRLDGSEILGRGLTPGAVVAWPPSVHPPLPVPGQPASDTQLAAAEMAFRTR